MFSFEIRRVGFVCQVATACILALLPVAATAVEPAPPAMVIVTVSSLRSDRVTSQSGRSSRTPFLQSLGTRGALLERMRTPVPSPVPALASLFTGLEPRLHGAFPGGTVAPGIKSLAQALATKGYSTSAWTNLPVTTTVDLLTSGYDRVVTEADQSAPILAARAVEAEVKALRKGGHLVWIHLGDAAAPYQPQEKDLEKMRQDKWNASWNFPLAVAPTGGVPHTLPAAAVSGSMREAAYYMDAYDAVLLQVDQSLEALAAGFLPALKESGGYLVIASLHGEAMGEHGHWFSHGHSLFEEEILVPVCVIGPDVQPLARPMSHSWGSLTDLMPTLLALLGQPPLTPPGIDHGFNLAPLLRGSSSPPTRYVHSGMDRPPFSRSMLADGRFKIIMTPARPASVDPGTGWPEKESVVLYDLNSDPLEAMDIATSRGVVAHELKVYLSKNAPAWPGTPPAMDRRRRR